MLFNKISSTLYRYEGSEYNDLSEALYDFIEEVFTPSGPTSVAVEISPSFEKKLLREFKPIWTGIESEVNREENYKKFTHNKGVIYFFTRKLEIEPEPPYGFRKAQRN